MLHNEGMKETELSIGPYRILELLGRGGMGIVYRARHDGTGQEVALKTVRLVRHGLLESLRREIRALARIRHPGIIGIVSDGIKDGLPWYAMELLDGLPLNRFMGQLLKRRAISADPWADQASTGAETLSVTTANLAHEETPEEDKTDPPRGPCDTHSAQPRHKERRPAAGGKLELVLKIVLRLCSALAYLHGEGLVHRDLKPGNVFVQGGEWPILMDFGLMSQVGGEGGREILEIISPIAGSVHTMAPEQIRGAPVDARADLYALGCMLYELLTSRRPFEAPTPQDVLLLHLAEPPVHPSEYAEDIPAELEELVLRLLSKAPEDRIGYVESVVSILESVLQKVSGRKKVSWNWLGAPRPKPHLYPPRFRGRYREFEAMKERLTALSRHRGGIVLINGESGIGKTRFVKEIAEQAHKYRIAVYAGQCPPAPPGGRNLMLGPLRPVLRAIADRCRERGEEETKRLLGDGAKLLSLYEPTLAALPGSSQLTSPQNRGPLSAKNRLFNILAKTLLEMGKSQRALVILDDLQWADELSLGFLEFLLRHRSLDDSSLLLLGAYRNETIGTPLARLLEAPGYDSVELRSLAPSAVDAMVRDMLALKTPTADLFAFLARQSEGNPFFASELIRTGLEQGILSRDRAGLWTLKTERNKTLQAAFEALPISNSLQELVAQRLTRLSKKARKLVQAASVLGKPASAAVLAKIAKLRRSHARRATQELLTRHVFRQVNGEHLEFTHQKLREIANLVISGKRLGKLHRRAAKLLSKRMKGVDSDQMASLGRHWELGGSPEQARNCYLASAQNAKTRHALETAASLYEDYLRLCQTPTPESVATRNELGLEVLQVQGEYKKALDHHQRAFQEAKTLRDDLLQVASLVNAARARQRLGQVAQARSLFEEALGLLRSTPNPAAQGDALCYLANLHVEQGQLAVARPLLEQAVQLYRQTGNRRNVVVGLRHLGDLFSHEGRFEQARQFYTEVLSIYRALDQPENEAATLLSLGIIMREQGLFTQAAKTLQKSLTLHQKIGQLRGVGTSTLQLSLLAHSCGDSEESERHCNGALEIFRTIAERRGEGYALLQLATLARRRRQFTDSKELCQQALTLFQNFGDQRGASFVMLELGSIHRDQGDWEQGRSVTQRALERLHQVGNHRDEATALGQMAALQRLQGHFSTACSLLQKAIELLANSGDSMGLAKTLCQIGHLALASGESAEPQISQVSSLIESMKLGQPSELAQTLARLLRAQEIYLSEPQRLFNGELFGEQPDDPLPPSLIS